MANMLKNLDLFDEDANSKLREYWAKKSSSASVEVVKKPRDKAKESEQFFKAQEDLVKDVLPKAATADTTGPLAKKIEKQDLEKMELTPQQALQKVYPNGGWPLPNPATAPGLQLDVKGYTTKAGENKCNIGTNIGSLIEDALIKTNKNNMSTIIDVSAAIAATKEKKVLNKPFKTPNATAAYAVYTKNGQGDIVRVNFNACQASDPNDLGPTWGSKFWGSKVKAEAEAKEQSLNDFWNFYSEKVIDPKKDLDWDGKTFHRQDELVKTMPELVNSKPSYEDENVQNNTGKPSFSDAKGNPERKLNS